MAKSRSGSQSKPPTPTALRDAAIAAARAAGAVLLRRFRTRLKVMEKPGEGIVTNADFESERAAIRVLKSAFPDFGILTEESGPRAARSPGRFILDPLDGTSNFAHGFPHFCVSLGVEWAGRIVSGVVFQPVTGEVYSAVLGKGAFVNGKRMRVSRVGKLESAFLTTGFCSRKEEWLAQEIKPFEKLSLRSSGVRRPGSAALDLSQVARGVFDGFWERGLKPWDIAAGSLIVREAGGEVTDFRGESVRLDSQQVLASNGRLHAELVREVGLA